MLSTSREDEGGNIDEKNASVTTTVSEQEPHWRAWYSIEYACSRIETLPAATEEVTVPFLGFVRCLYLIVPFITDK